MYQRRTPDQVEEMTLSQIVRGIWDAIYAYRDAPIGGPENTEIMAQLDLMLDEILSRHAKAKDTLRALIAPSD